MKIIVLADIHGNYDALQAVLEDVKRERADKIYSLGDNIGYGPEPDRVVEELIRQHVISVMGNHEYALVNSRYFNRLNPPARESLEINIAHMSEQARSFSESLPLFLIDSDLRFVHGCPPKSAVAYLFDPSPRMLDKVFASFAEQISFYGHTHTCDLIEYDQSGSKRQEIAMGTYPLHPQKRYLINPGSVGQPRDGINSKAKYLVLDLEEMTVCFRAVSYDIKLVVEKIKALGMPDFNWERLVFSYE